MTQTPDTTLSQAFIKHLQAEIGEIGFAEAVDRNRAEPNPSICHTHDFCDANQIMLDAFEEVHGREPDVRLYDSEDMEDIQDAWALFQIWAMIQ